MAPYTGILLVLAGWLVLLSGMVVWLVLRVMRSRAELTDQADQKISSTAELEKELKTLQKQTKQAIGHVGLIRFNPFGEVGSDQSFSLALLDGKKNGFVMTSLHARSSTRVYAKPVLDGKSVRHDLSKEEEHAIEQALE